MGIKSFNRPAILASLVVAASFASSAFAGAIIWDGTVPGATNNGTIGAGEYVGGSSGINSGFGNVIGSGATLYLDSDRFTNVQAGLKLGGGGLYDIGVIYIDSVAGGFASTQTLSDHGDPHRNAISGDGYSGEFSDLFFAPGFEADYAIAFNKDFAGVWKLAAGGNNSLQFIASANGNPLGNPTISDYEMNFAFADIGLAGGLGTSFKYVVTYLNGGNGYRSNEFIGVAQSTWTGGNVGNNFNPPGNVTLASGDFNTFIVVPAPAALPAGLLAASIFGMARRRR